MPLPPALLARLARRGIVEADDVKKSSDQHMKNAEEEVIAEDYDELAAEADLEHNYIHNKHGTKLVTTDPAMGVLGCPNKWNVHHECSPFCQERWGWGRDPDPRQQIKRLRMLEKFPLPASWSEVYDPGTGRYYYWDTESEMVSWLPPSHPRAMPGACAAALRVQIKLLDEQKQRQQQQAAADAAVAKNSDGEHDDDDVASDDEDVGVPGESDRKIYNQRLEAPGNGEETDDRKRRERNDRDRGDGRDRRDRNRPRDRGDRERDGRRTGGRDWRGQKRRGEDDVDPMDPAAYSDVPRGGWSAGLERDVKTGVDSTASGPLFQQRPYPSPGDVLRANSARK